MKNLFPRKIKEEKLDLENFVAITFQKLKRFFLIKQKKKYKMRLEELY